MRVGSLEFWLLDLFLVILIIVGCQLWDKYDQYKIKKLTEKNQSK